MSYLFDRIAKVIIGTTSTEAIVFDERFRITFNIIKNNTSVPTLSTISIYNLSFNDRHRLESIPGENIKRKGKEPALLLLLYAGYREASGYELLYIGHITSVNTIYTPPDYISEITCGNGLIPLNTTVINLSFAAGIGTNQIIKQLADAVKMDISKSSNYLQTNISFAKGYSYSGLAKNALDEVTKEARLKWSVEKEQLLITPIDKATKDVIIELDATSGLIGIPTKSANNLIADVYDSGKFDGWNLKSLLQPSIIPSRKIRVISKGIAGDFLVDSVTHKGDTRSGEWISDIETRVSGVGGL